jgi:hypothetical protein
MSRSRLAVRVLALVALAPLVLPAAAAAQGLRSGDGAWPQEITRRPLTLDAGMVELWLPVNMNLADGRELEPVNLNPSLYFGVTDSWMIGVRHFVGICATGEDEGCAEPYDDVSLDTVFAFGRGSGLNLGVGASLNYAPIKDDPAWSAEVRLLARAGGGAVALTVMPTLNFGLNDRDRDSDLLPDEVPAVKWTGTPLNLGTYNVLTPAISPGNREYLLIPVTLQLQLGKLLALAAGASLNGPINAEDLDFGDVYTIPVSVAAVFTLFPNVDLGAALTFPNLAGADFEEEGVAFQLANGTDDRQLSVFATFRL